MKKRIAEWYIRNKPKILFVLMLVLVVIVINIILVFTIKNKDDDQEESDRLYSTADTLSNNFNTITMESPDSVISGDELTSKQVSMATVIEQFVEYCNNKDINSAYNMLTDECKQEMYNNVESFTTNYYNKVFNSSKRVSVENWIENIYKVEFTEDFLATGVYSEDNIIQDYIRVIEVADNQYKLNINSYIGREEINKTKENDVVNVTVLRSDTYMDYQTYTFRVTNKTTDAIVLDDRQYTDSMYLEDENGIQYSAYSQELSEPELTISQNETKDITIKYYNKYGSEKNITKIGFLRIAPKYDVLYDYNYEKLEINLN